MDEELTELEELDPGEQDCCEYAFVAIPYADDKAIGHEIGVRFQDPDEAVRYAEDVVRLTEAGAITIEGADAVEYQVVEMLCIDGYEDEDGIIFRETIYFRR